MVGILAGLMWGGVAGAEVDKQPVAVEDVEVEFSYIEKDGLKVKLDENGLPVEYEYKGQVTKFDQEKMVELRDSAVEKGDVMSVLVDAVMLKNDFEVVLESSSQPDLPEGCLSDEQLKPWGVEIVNTAGVRLCLTQEALGDDNLPFKKLKENGKRLFIVLVDGPRLSSQYLTSRNRDLAGDLFDDRVLADDEVEAYRAKMSGWMDESIKHAQEMEPGFQTWRNNRWVDPTVSVRYDLLDQYIASKVLTDDQIRAIAGFRGITGMHYYHREGVRSGIFGGKRKGGTPDDSYAIFLATGGYKIQTSAVGIFFGPDGKVVLVREDYKEGDSFVPDMKKTKMTSGDLELDPEATEENGKYLVMAGDGRFELYHELQHLVSELDGKDKNEYQTDKGALGMLDKSGDPIRWVVEDQAKPKSQISKPPSYTQYTSYYNPNNMQRGPGWKPFRPGAQRAETARAQRQAVKNLRSAGGENIT